MWWRDERPEAGVEPVDGLAAGQHAVDHVARRAHADQCLGVELDARVAARDGEHIIHRQAVAAENDVLVG